LVLAIGFPASDFTLVEPMQRRAGFLELCVADLGLRNVSTRTGRTGVLSQAGFDVAVARALKEPGAAVDDLARLVRIGGAVILAIGPTAKVAPPARIVRVEVPGNVDSPGLFSMMTHRG
jgi:16S rRNA (guanine527-N7)-methyltransferase